MDGKTLLATGCLTMAIITGVRGETLQEMVRKGGTPDRLDLTVIVHFETEVRWLPAAQGIAASLFEDAGIRLSWIHCSRAAADPACSRAPAANELVVRLQRTRLDRASHQCGIALRPRRTIGSYITLFLDCLSEGSEQFRIEEPVVGAYSLAHEIGHLLLPTSAHSASGIMQPLLRPIDWERAARGSLRFHSEEQRYMAEALRRRSPAGFRAARAQDRSGRGAAR